jgi:hypothetical protein
VGESLEPTSGLEPLIYRLQIVRAEGIPHLIPVTYAHTKHLKSHDVISLGSSGNYLGHQSMGVAKATAISR